LNAGPRRFVFSLSVLLVFVAFAGGGVTTAQSERLRTVDAGRASVGHAAAAPGLRVMASLGPSVMVENPVNVATAGMRDGNPVAGEHRHVRGREAVSRTNRSCFSTCTTPAWVVLPRIATSKPCWCCNVHKNPPSRTWPHATTATNAGLILSTRLDGPVHHR
jgi:hypothetical protein